MNLRYIVIILLFFTIKSVAQLSKLEQKEIELVKLYDKVSLGVANYKSLKFYSQKFEQELIKLVKENSGTLSYTFKKLLSNRICYVTTSEDGKFRVYSWDDGTGGTMRNFKSIIQWETNNQVFTKVINKKNDIDGSYCSKIYLINVLNIPTYFLVTNSIGSSKDLSQAISPYCINGNNLTNPKIFKAKNKMLNYINVYFDFFSVYERPERPLELITYNKNRNSIFIPFVDDNGVVKNKVLVYQLKSTGYFEYIGVEPYKFN